MSRFGEGAYVRNAPLPWRFRRRCRRGRHHRHRPGLLGLRGSGGRPAPDGPRPARAGASAAEPAGADTGEPGEVIVSWGTGTGANSYRVGWLNHNDYLAAGSDWLQRFTFANVPLRTREYKITRLTPGEEYWFIVASVDAQNRMYWPAQWIEKFTVTPYSRLSRLAAVVASRRGF